VTEIKLDRMALDDVGANPRRLAEAIHGQLGERKGPVLVDQIARALDIEEIREERISNIEAALVTDPERSYGSILVNLNSSPQRRRFSIGHELGHFLNPLHEPTSSEGFRCTRSDMILAAQNDQDRYVRQEAEANTFAIELLAPRGRVKSYLNPSPDLAKVLRLAGDLDISREAAARRYVELHDETLAVVFCASGKFSYARRKDEFPSLCLRQGQPLNLLGDGRMATFRRSKRSTPPTGSIVRSASSSPHKRCFSNVGSPPPSSTFCIPRTTKNWRTPTSDLQAFSAGDDRRTTSYDAYDFPAIPLKIPCFVLKFPARPSREFWRNSLRSPPIIGRQ
jgi:IrrE N-terminal-like domain